MMPITPTETRSCPLSLTIPTSCNAEKEWEDEDGLCLDEEEHEDDDPCLFHPTECFDDAMAMSRPCTVQDNDDNQTCDDAAVSTDEQGFMGNQNIQMLTPQQQSGQDFTLLNAPLHSFTQNQVPSEPVTLNQSDNDIVEHLSLTPSFLPMAELDKSTLVSMAHDHNQISSDHITDRPTMTWEIPYEPQHSYVIHEGKNFVFCMKPQHLGYVQVQIHMKKSKISVSIVTESHKAMKHLQKDSDQLIHALQDNQVSLDFDSLDWNFGKHQFHSPPETKTFNMNKQAKQKHMPFAWKQQGFIENSVVLNTYV